MASQWPKPEGFDGDIDPFDLVDRFKEHFLSICRYTADNPTATAPASYVMETMFQANKIVAVLAKNLNDVANARFPEPGSEPEPEPEPAQPPANQLSLQDRLAVLSNMFEVKQEEPTEETSAEVEEADEVAQELSTLDIFGPDLNPDDSEEDGDWGSESSEDDSDDDYYEYGSFGDDSEKEEEEEGEEEEEEEEDSEAQEDATALDDDENMEDECEDEVAEDGDPQAKDQMKASGAPNDVSQQSSQRYERYHVRIGWSHKTSPYMDPYLGYPRCDQFVKRAIHSSTNAEVRSVNLLYTKWYDMSGDCDLFVETAAEKELLIHNSDSWLPLVDNAQYARIKNRNSLPKRPDTPDGSLDPWNLHCHYFRMTWVLGVCPYKCRPSLLLTEMNTILRGHSDERLSNVKLKEVEVDLYCGDAIVHASEEDVYLLTSLSHLWANTLERAEEIEMQTKFGVVIKTSKHKDVPISDGANAIFRIRWHCPDPPYKEYDTRGIKHSHIHDMLHAALKMTDSPSLAAISFSAVKVKWKSGDVDVISTQRDRDRAVEYAPLWFPHLIQGEAAVIPGIYAPESRTSSKELGRRRSNASKRNLEDVSALQTNLSRSLSKSAKRKRQKIRSQQRRQDEQENQAPYMQVVSSGVAM